MRIRRRIRQWQRSGRKWQAFPGGSARECATGLYAGHSAGVKAAKVAGEGGHTAGLPGSGGYGSDHVHHTRKGIPFQGNSKGAGREV